jgi:hypothetical protein
VPVGKGQQFAHLPFVEGGETNWSQFFGKWPCRAISRSAWRRVMSQRLAQYASNEA